MSFSYIMYINMSKKPLNIFIICSILTFEKDKSGSPFLRISTSYNMFDFEMNIKGNLWYVVQKNNTLNTVKCKNM